MNNLHWRALDLLNITYRKIADNLLRIARGSQKKEVETVRNYISARFGVPVERVFVTPGNGEYQVVISLESPMEALEMEVKLG